MSQKEMGELLSVPWRSYQNYEVGTREPPAALVASICERFGIRFQWLLTGQGGPKAMGNSTNLRRIILLVDQKILECGVAINSEARADIIARLFERQSEGFEIVDTEVRNYVELAGRNLR